MIYCFREDGAGNYLSKWVFSHPALELRWEVTILLEACRSKKPSNFVMVPLCSLKYQLMPLLGYYCYQMTVPNMSHSAVQLVSCSPSECRKWFICFLETLHISKFTMFPIICSSFRNSSYDNCHHLSYNISLNWLHCALFLPVLRGLSVHWLA